MWRAPAGSADQNRTLDVHQSPESASETAQSRSPSSRVEATSNGADDQPGAETRGTLAQVEREVDNPVASLRPTNSWALALFRSAALGPLIGRAGLVAQLLSWIDDDRNRLVTLTGPGGTGKTHLAIEGASDAQGLFAGRVWLLDVSAVTDPMQLLPQIAGMFRIQEGDDQPLEE